MFKKRVYMARYLIVIVLILLCVRLMHIGIISGKTYETMAQNQQNKKLVVKHKRGGIYDCNGIALTEQDTQRLYLNSRGEISTEKSDSVYEFEIKKRFSTYASHIIGYIDCDGNGVSGVEKQYNDFLKSSSTVYLNYMANASGRPVRDYLLSSEGDAKHSINLTIDNRIQKICEDVADEYIKKGAVVVLDVKNFDVLASVSRPTFEPEKILAYGKSGNGELLNRVLMQYNAGSVFKIITSATAIENNYENLNRLFNCKGYFRPDRQHLFYCHKTDGHGMLNFNDAFAQSCNCAFYAMALDCGAENIINKATDFGIGSKLLNSPLGEACGNLPVRPLYTPAETLNIAIGQGEIMITPLQCAVMVATVAGGGIRKDVNIVKSFEENGKRTDAKNKGAVRVISKSTADIICRMMRDCVIKGTGVGAFDCTVNIAGKTGSAETGISDKNGTQVHGWFCGFFPAQSPKYAVVVFSENGKSGGRCTRPFVEIVENISALCG